MYHSTGNSSLHHCGKHEIAKKIKSVAKKVPNEHERLLLMKIDVAFDAVQAGAFVQ